MKQTPFSLPATPTRHAKALASAEALAKEGGPPIEFILWDAEHRFPHNVGPEKLRLT